MTMWDVKPLTGKNHTLQMTNVYNSPESACFMREKNTYASYKSTEKMFVPPFEKTKRLIDEEYFGQHLGDLWVLAQHENDNDLIPR